MDYLKKLGFETYREHLEKKQGTLNGRIARVLSQHNKIYTIAADNGIWDAACSGKLFYTGNNENIPVAGDWVLTDKSADERITEVLPRKSKLSRKTAGEKTQEQIIAANIDIAFIVTGLDHNFNLRRIERLLTIAYDSGAEPVIILNKADIIAPEALTRAIAETEETALGVPVHITSIVHQVGLEEVGKYLKQNKTAVFIGSSGVGKSSMINFLLGENTQKVKEIRDSDGRGRHTTSSAALFTVPGGGCIIDTPGMREIQLWTGEEPLQYTFADIHQLSGSCKFRNCSHTTEPGCAVIDAVESGKISRKHFDNFQKMQREIAYLERRKDEYALRTEKEQWKKRSRLIKEITNRKKG